MTRPSRWIARLVLALSIASRMAAAAHAADPVTPPPPPAPLPPPGTLAPGYGPRPLNPVRPKPYGDPDRGTVFGGALGYGTYNYYGCGSVCGDAWTGEIHGGGLLTNGLALEGEIWGGLHGFSNPQLGAGHSALSLWTLAFQWWFADTFWVKVGIGVGRIQSNSRRVDTALVEDSSIAFVLATGVELYRTYHTAIDLQVRYGSVALSGRDDNPNPVAALVGLSWR
jgi:hypothetical protein